MSARKPRLQLAPEARRDIRDIHLYGLDHWGEQQADIFHATLRRAFDTVRDHPQIGVARDNLMRGLRSLPVDHHVLYYRVTDDLIEVVRILHERADAAPPRDTPAMNIQQAKRLPLADVLARLPPRIREE